MSKMNMRKAYGEALLELGRANEKVVALEADLGKSTMSNMFGGEFPERYFQMGIAEANMISAAAGLALTGHVAFASTFAVFGAGRAFEQVRNSICYSKANVKIGCSHAGPSCGEDGGSHQAVEDISLMRTLPNMTVLVPADANEMEKAVFAAAKYDGPVYIRTGRLPTDICIPEDMGFEIGKANLLKDGRDVAIIACGIMVPQALMAAEALEARGIHARVLDMHTIKPLDEEAVRSAAKDCGAVVTAEEHSIIGGLGSAVAEVLADRSGVPFERVGIMDRFGQSGKPPILFEEYGLTDKAILAACERVMERK